MRSTLSLLCLKCAKKTLPKIRIQFMLCIVFKVPPNLIGSQYEKLIIQKLNVTLDLISDYHGHASIPAHRIPHC